jgi:CheY-like chemotaxis protein
MARKRSSARGCGAEVALLISDVVMPVMDGPTMVREARKSIPTCRSCSCPGYAEEQLRKSIDIANVAFLPKPFSVLNWPKQYSACCSGLNSSFPSRNGCYSASRDSTALHPHRRRRAPDCMMLEDFIESLGHGVRGPCESVTEALAAVEADGFDLAILDVNLKGESVWPVATALRAKGVPFVLCVGRACRAAAGRVRQHADDRKAYTIDRVSPIIDAALAAAC